MAMDELEPVRSFGHAGVHCATSDLRPSDAMGMLHLGVAAVTTVAGLMLSAASTVPVWLAGQGLLAVALLKWFVLLHEAGHMTLFRSRTLNHLAGHLASVFALIPFAGWRRIHGLHHLWTGWQDKDPTTAALTPRPRSAFQRRVADIAWRCWLPLFSVAYRFGNYWNVPRLWRQFPSRRRRCALLLNVALLALLYAGIVAYLDIATAINVFGLALLFGLALQDPIILSQHTHIPQPVSQGRPVVPLSAREQLRYTRSLRFPRWFARWVLINFNAHELHHLHPGVSGYHLDRIDAHQPNEVHWWTWIRAAKRLSGSQFVFGNREQTGFDQ